MLGPSLLSLIFSLGVLLVSKAAIENQKIKIRKNLYLCLKSKEANLKKYINKMTYFNIAIRASFVAQAIPALSV